ncbi:hypothetical protein STRTUCAR8_06812 [Streptomyces turgidiscabies Car8]|uniref:Uncharacterized protein n=1 Tax=Streptomyces turgidiscabies (strain Car8) TaxID=698760 RepID=L7F7X5_STRT8|nr:hypothetical protein STRTUCAR8_06812 [Streptomyces turgidiscabies Car8]
MCWCVGLSCWAPDGGKREAELSGLLVPPGRRACRATTPDSPLVTHSRRHGAPGFRCG